MKGDGRMKRNSETFAQLENRIPEARIGDLGTDFKSVPLPLPPRRSARRENCPSAFRREFFPGSAARMIMVGKCPRARRDHDFQSSHSVNERTAVPQAGEGTAGGNGVSQGRRGGRMIVAGGGTGGHLFPGIAIAEEFLRRDPRNRVLFIGTERGLEKKILGPLGFPLRILKVEGLKGRGVRGIAASLLKIPGSLVASFEIIREFKPDVVIGVGGYASGPAVLMARLMGKKTAIAEQNAFPGLTNRILGRFAHRVFLSFSASQKWFPAGRTRGAGNPI